MRLASAAQPARTWLAGANRLRGVPCNTGRENRQFLLQPRRAAVRTFSSLPVGGPHEDFAVLVAFVTMKFVDRHVTKVARGGKISSRSSRSSRRPPDAWIMAETAELPALRNFVAYATKFRRARAKREPMTTSRLRSGQGTTSG